MFSSNIKYIEFIYTSLRNKQNSIPFGELFRPVSQRVHFLNIFTNNNLMVHDSCRGNCMKWYIVQHRHAAIENAQ
jgi:hypothetical protein